MSGQHGRRWLVLVALALSQLMIVLDATVLNIALPSAQRDLGFSDNDRQWVITAYALAFGSLLLLSGRLSDRFGRKRMLIIGLVGFAVASGAGGAASTFGLLVAARVLQGGFAALLAPAALALLSTTFTDPKERARAFGIFGSISVVGSTLGLILGGALTEYLSWRWTMYINVIIAIPALIGAALLISRGTSLGRPRIDIPGALAVTLGLFSLVFGFSKVQTDGWGAAITLAFLGAAVLFLVVFVLIQQRVTTPLIPLRVVLDRNRGGTLISMLVAPAGMGAVFLFLAYYLQETLRYTEVQTGLAFLPLPVAVIVSAAVIGPRLGKRVGPKFIIPLGLVVAAIGVLLLTRISSNSQYSSAILPSMVILGLGLGLVFAIGPNVATLGVEATDAGAASAVLNTVQQVGGSVGIALLNTVATTAATAFLVGRMLTPSVGTSAAIHGYTTAFWWIAGIFLASALVIGVLLRRGVLEEASHADAGTEIMD